MNAERPAPQNVFARAAPKVVVALGLTFTAGFVDVIGYLAVYHFFTANMTGNTVHFAHNLLQRRWTDAALAGFIILAFFIGSVIGRTIIEVGARRRIRSIASLTLATEATLITLVVISPAGGTTWVLTLLGAAMGLQTATLTRIGPLTVHTTFVTGMLNKLAQLVSHTLFLSYDLVRGREDVRRVRRISLRRTAFIFSIWVLYFVGAVAGTVAERTSGLRVLAVPVAVLAAAIVVDQAWPLSVREEQDQAESAA